MRLLLLAALVWALPAAAAPVELLHNVPSSIQVSSRVESKTIEPAHLVDGDRNTAWNSARGELVGAWVELTVPAEVTVDEIKLIVGHTGKGKEGDYFPMNHRIKKLRVLNGKTKLGDFELDPNNRELQSIKIGKPGGTYRLQVLATVPGTKKSWRELAIAELEVWGTLPAGMTPRRHEIRPEFGIDTEKPRGKVPVFRRASLPMPTWEEICKRTNCTPNAPEHAKLAPKASAFKNVVVEPGTNRGYARVYVQTDAGWFYVGGLSQGGYTDATYSGTVEKLEVKDDILQIVVDMKPPTGTDHARFFFACGVAPDKRPSCLEEAIGLEVIHTKYNVSTQHVVSIANGYLSVDRGKLKAWEWIIGDHKLAF